MKSHRIKVAFIKAGNALKDYRMLTENNVHYHHHLSEMMNSLDSTYDRYFYSFGSSREYYREEGLQFQVLRTNAQFAVFSRLNRILASSKLFSLLCRDKPEIVVANAANDFIIPAYLYKLFFGCRLVSSNHGEVNAKANILFRSLNLFILNRVNALIVHGPYLEASLKQKLEESQSNNIRVYDIPCLDLNSLGAVVAPMFNKLNGERILTFIGRIEEDKGAKDVFEAVKPILRSNKSIRLVYAGDGSFKACLREMIREHEMDKQVIILGRIDRSQIASLLLSSDVSIAATQKRLSEGRCQSVIEALSMGVPVVAPNYGAFQYTFKDRSNGRFFEADNVCSLKESIEEVLKDHEGYKKRSIMDKQQFIRPEFMTYSEAINDSI